VCWVSSAPRPAQPPRSPTAWRPPTAFLPFGRCATAPIERRRFAARESIELRVAVAAEGSSLSGTNVALDALADMQALSECDYFVLVLRSAVSRIAYSLAAARRHQLRPIISLQWPWGGPGGGGGGGGTKPRRRPNMRTTRT
jgi:hypothetical protein